MNELELRSRVQACLLGVAIGDAMGMPWETMTYEAILEKTNGTGVTGFVDPIQRQIKGTMPLKAGDTTDDWQLTAAVARSLIRKRGFDIEDIARQQAIEFDRCTFGWGPTTRRSLKEIKRWFESGGKEGRSPTTPAQSQGPGLGAGNGVAMKVAPLGFLMFHGKAAGQDLSDVLKNSMSDVAQLGFLTHSDARASHAAFAVAQAIAMVMDHPITYSATNYDPDQFLPFIRILYSGCDHMETVYPCPKGVSMDDGVQDRLGFIASILGSKTMIGAGIARRMLGTDCLCTKSVPFAIATFLRHPTDFRFGILEAVSAGGDTDSTASMVGAMIGANVGLEGIPGEWREFSPLFQEALELGEQLTDLILERNGQKMEGP